MTTNTHELIEALDALIEHATNCEHQMNLQDFDEFGPSKVIYNAERARQALTATPAQSGWRPMSEAPKDGTPILGYKPFNGNWKEDQDHLVEVRWRTDSFGRTGFMGLRGQRWNVTKWMPRPLPPQNEGGGHD